MMTENSEKAFGSNYFNSPELPVAVAEVSASPLAQHAHDLTERDHFHDFSELVLVTGGSDFHGMYSRTARPLGNSDVPENVPQKMRMYKSRRNASAG